MLATSQLDICNNALALVGQGQLLNSLDDNKKEALICKRLYQRTIERALDKYNFSFVRKDEVITKDFLLADAVSLPWLYTYTIPDDVMRVLFLTPLCANSNVERINNKITIPFNFRQYDSKRVLVTNQEYPFVIHYQSCDFENINFPPTFTEAVEYLLAGAIACDLIKGTTGLQIANALNNQGLQLLDYSAMLDAQQGGQSIEAYPYSNSIVKSRL